MFDSIWKYRIEKRSGASVIDELLQSRGITDASIFLNPSFDGLHDPFSMNDMEKAVSRIKDALENKEKICIYGDYDADGLTSAAILVRMLRAAGADPGFFIPDRFDDGYGMNIESLRLIAQKGFKLVITTDCGINSIDEVNYLNENELDCIITDHHKSNGLLPEACAVICCTRNDNRYPFENLSGAGVAYKLAVAVKQSLELDYNENEMLSLAAIGTVADIVPLKGENRIIASKGIEAIIAGSIPGIDAILENAGISTGNITAETLGFVIGPRLNAAGRMGNAGKAFQLLLTDDYYESRKLADSLSRMNNKRKSEQDRVLRLVNESLKKEPNSHNSPVIVIGGENFHKGVIGIVSAKITETYNKPSIILSISDEIAEGSGRSIIGFSLIDALNYCRDSLISFGGHENAAGLSLKRNYISKLRELMSEYSNYIGLKSESKNTIDIDFMINDIELNFANTENIGKLAPFGNGNRAPVFSISKAELFEIRKIGRTGKHLKMLFKIGDRFFDAVSFNTAFYLPLLKPGNQYDISFIPEINEFRGKRNLQLMIKDIRFCIDDNISIEYMIVSILADMLKYEKDTVDFESPADFASVLFENGMPDAANTLNNGAMGISRADIETAYKALKEYKPGDTIDIKESELGIIPYKMLLSVEILAELRIISTSMTGLNEITVTGMSDTTKRNLGDSVLFRFFGEK
jgi:single-stranded-DNA-specific exonuclease